MPRRTLLALIAVALVAGGAVALRPVDDEPSASVSAPPAAGSARAGLAAVERDRNRLLDGGLDAFRARLATLRGAPVVVNQWASWCGPCRYEFPFFQDLARRYEGRVAFLGVNSQDVDDDARAFLKEFPTPFPHYSDPDVKIAREFKGGRAWPTTAFYAADGSLARTHLGGYGDQADLDADIRKWALGG